MYVTYGEAGTVLYSLYAAGLTFLFRSAASGSGQPEGVRSSASSTCLMPAGKTDRDKDISVSAQCFSTWGSGNPWRKMIYIFSFGGGGVTKRYANTLFRL